jgi:hypothetical protein
LSVPIIFSLLIALRQCTAAGMVKEFVLYKDSIVHVNLLQSLFFHRTDLYQSLKNFIGPRISFKFSLNGKDNEMPSGKDHHFVTFKTGYAETPLLVLATVFRFHKNQKVFLRPIQN